MLDRLLDRGISVTMVLLVSVVLGIIGMSNLPVSLIPEVDIPLVSVQVTAPDMSARELNDAVIKPLRQGLVQINHLKDLTSEAIDGTATIKLTFEEGQDIDFLYIEVNEKVDRAMSSLPRIDRPKVLKASATDIPAFYINLTLKDEGLSIEEDRDPNLYPVPEKFVRLSNLAREVISKRVEQLPEVAMVDMTGIVDNEILIIPDEDALRRIGMNIGTFESCVSSANVHLSNLTIRDGEYHYNVKFQSFASTAEDISEIYFRSDDRLLQVKDVAKVIEHPSMRTGLALSDGKDAVVMAVIKNNDARMSDLKGSIAAQLKAFEADYPDVSFEITRDQTELLDYSIRNLFLNIILAICLVGLIIFLFMRDFRSPLLVAFTIPVAIIISFFFFYLIGISINIISLSGLLLGLGMMVDNSIILVDNITGRWERGEDLRISVTSGTREIAGPMLSSVLTTCAVFIPLIFLNGLSGDLFFDQALSITIVLLTSYLVTVIVLPVYYYNIYKKHDTFEPSPLLSHLKAKNVLKFYEKGMDWSLARHNLTWLLPLVSLALMVVCLVGMQRSKLPPVTYTDAVFRIDWNEHITLGSNRGRVEEIRAGIASKCAHTTALVGVQQFMLSHSGDQSLGEASLYVKCKDPWSLEEVRNEIVDQVHRNHPSARLEEATSGNIFELVFSNDGPQVLASFSPDSDAGLQISDVQNLLEDIKKRAPELKIEDIPLKTDVLYVSDPQKMSLYGVTFQDLTSVLRNAVNGNRLFEIVQGNRTLPVVLGTDVRKMEDILSSTLVGTSSGMEIPVRVLMRQTYEQDFKVIVSGDRGDYYPLPLEIDGKKASSVMEKIKAAVHENGKFDVFFSGSWFSNKELLRQMLMILLVAVSLLFLILASQFESFVQPLIILSEIIIDIAASLCVLWIAGVSLNVMSLIGLVVVSGIVINDSILKISTINSLVSEGSGVDEAIHEAGRRRLKPIIMTSLTTILAVVPFLSRGNMGDDLQYPMALVIIAGMTVGTLVSLFFVPAVYSSLYNKRDRNV